MDALTSIFGSRVRVSAGSGEAGQKRGSGDIERGSGTGPILLSQATFLLLHIANSGPIPLSVLIEALNLPETGVSLLS